MIFCHFCIETINSKKAGTLSIESLPASSDEYDSLLWAIGTIYDLATSEYVLLSFTPLGSTLDSIEQI
jgi:hypothetical protein|tara:strand:+ start:3714 stop:3917 length:204 start_codon:yes stop_codon:yes gene_type:complete